MRCSSLFLLGPLALGVARGHESGPSPAQFCKVDGELGVDFCVAFSSYRNLSSNGNDLYIRTSTRFKDRMGWSAVGTGETMSGALMFVFYPASAHSDEATVSLRTAGGHYPPQLAQNAPNYEVLDVSVQNHYYDISVVCYSCNKWDGNAVDVKSEAQAMIYAAQVDAKIQSADKAAPLSHHTDYGKFNINLSHLHSESASPRPPAFTNNGRKTAGLDGKSSQNYHWHKYHGILMVVSFTIMMPSAVMYLRSGLPRAFTVHWAIQAAAAMMAISSATFAIVKSWDSFEMRPQTTLSQHLTLGTLITVVLVVQPMLGYYHHVCYVKLHRRTFVSHLHIWVGRALIVFAWANTGLGLKLAHTGSTYMASWFILVGMAALGMVWAPTVPTVIRAIRKSGGEAVYKTLDPKTEEA